MQKGRASREQITGKRTVHQVGRLKRTPQQEAHEDEFSDLVRIGCRAVMPDKSPGSPATRQSASIEFVPTRGLMMLLPQVQQVSDSTRLGKLGLSRLT
ncbi:hypothetical protein Mapa_010467 [Marchantia paleacea]|nr:hypothetical protein Mapa_010467 [Marchantia paleacea]